MFRQLPSYILSYITKIYNKNILIIKAFIFNWQNVYVHNSHYQHLISDMKRFSVTKQHSCVRSIHLFFNAYRGFRRFAYMPLLILRLCVFSVKKQFSASVFTGHGQRFDFLFSASRAKECLLSTCLHNSSAWPINSRAARVAKLLQTVFRQVGIIFDAGC